MHPKVAHPLGSQRLGKNKRLSPPKVVGGHDFSFSKGRILLGNLEGGSSVSMLLVI